MLGRMDFVREKLFPKIGDVADSVLLVNVQHDQILVPMSDRWGEPNGTDAITDRRKLLELLTILRNRGDYKYILLDVFFEEGWHTDVDSSLFSTILSMPRIVIPYHSDGIIADSRLMSKAGMADYMVNFNESDFVKYPFLKDGEKSLPVRMYEEMTGHKITKHGLFYTDGKRLARKSIVLTYDLRADQQYDIKGNIIWNNLGSDILEKGVPETCDKYIVIGSFQGNDSHMTFANKLSGAVINFNAYISLLHEHHLVSVTLIFILFFAFFVLSYLTLSRRKIQDILDSLDIAPQHRFLEWVLNITRFLCSWLGYSVFLSMLCGATYLLLNEAYDIFITATMFYLLDRLVAFTYFIKRKKI